jgi:tetratricopeptide (TPR) repeat protein
MIAIKLAIREEPMNSSYHSRKAKYAYELNQVSIAYSEALTAYQLGSQSLKQSLDLAKMGVALSEFSIVDEIIDSLLVVYPEDMDVLYMAARKYDKHKNIKLAKRYYEKVKGAQPDNLENIIFYTRFLIAQDNLSLAKEVLQSTTSKANTKQYYLLYGDVFAGLNQYDSAAIYYQQALTMSTDTATFSKTLNAYLVTHNLDSLISISKGAVLSYPESRKYNLIAARNLDLRRRYDEALPYYLTLYEMDTLDTLVVEELAYLQRKIAYLQRQKEAQKKLADSLSTVLPQLTF